MKKKLTLLEARAESEKGHAPRWYYDCDRCKFNWCCGPVCACVLRQRGDLGEPPRNRQREVDAALIQSGFQPEYRHRALARLKDPT